jgi:Flp pilus assembly protein TadG
MMHFWKKLRKDRRGNVLAMVGAGLPMLVGAAGLATDTINWALWKRELQRAADSGAIAGVYDRLSNAGKTDNTETAVCTDLDINNHTIAGEKCAGVLSKKVEFPADSGDNVNQVRVTLTVQRALPFSSLFMKTAPTITASATAASVPGPGEFCVIALDKSASAIGLDIGGSTTVDLGTCSVIALSAHPSQAAKNTGDASTFIAKTLATVGGVQYSNSDKWKVGSYEPGTPPIDDPYEDLPTPTSSDCDVTRTVDKKDFPIDWSADPADMTVCITGDVTIQGAAKLSKYGATYVLNGGNLTMNSTGSSLACEICSIILTNFSDRTATGNIQLTGGTLDISAPTADGHTYKGIAIYQDRLAKDDGKKGQNHVNGNDEGSVTGVIYTPNRSLLYNGGGTLKEGSCMQIIGKRLEFTGNSKIKLSSTCGGGMNPITGGRRVRLIA